MTRPGIPTLDALTHALTAFDDWPPSGANADRPEAVALADAARAVVTQYREEQRRYDHAVRMQINQNAVDLLRNMPSSFGGQKAQDETNALLDAQVPERVMREVQCWFCGARVKVEVTAVLMRCQCGHTTFLGGNRE